MTQSIVEDAHLIDLDKVSKDYGDTEALKGINLYIRRKEFITLLGPSGCGKTTTLRLIGGFEQPTHGKILFEGKDISGVPPHLRPLNTVFQRYALFPHLNVAENIAFGLKIKKLDRAEIDRRVSQMLEMVNLRGYGRRTVEQLSGGQQQRVAIARALVNHPRCLLLDEPLGALDLQLRKDMQLELKKMQQSLGITFVYVTHDQEEALTMSDTIVVMREGTIQQIGKPEMVYNEPKNRFVADFIGESNILEAVMVRDFVVVIDGHTFECVDKDFGKDTPVDTVIRPEDIKLVAPAEDLLCGVVQSVLFKGVHYEMRVQTEGFCWTVHSTIARQEGERVGISIVPFDIHIMQKTPAQDEGPAEASA